MQLGSAERAPAKLLLERHVPMAQRGAFEHWARGLLASAAETGALQGSSVLNVGEEAIIILRFSGRAALQAWQDNSDVAPMLRAWQTLGGATSERVRTGFETWFTLPGAGHPAPAKWKMALVTWLALLPHVLLLGELLPRDLPYPLGPALGTALPVASLTWLVMPRLSRLLARWLYPASPAGDSVHTAEAAHD